MKYSIESYSHKYTVNILIKRSHDITCPFYRESTDINTFIKLWMRI
jgi:hypothetical protein